MLIARMLIAMETGQRMFFLGLALLVCILLRRYFHYYRTWKRSGQRAPQPASSQPHGMAGLPLANGPAETLRRQVEMHDTARDLQAELDSKISVLQTLVRMADERIARLNQQMERGRARDGLDSRDVEELVSLEDITSQLLQSLPNYEAGRQTSNELPGSEDLRRSIYQLADRGWGGGADRGRAWRAWRAAGRYRVCAVSPNRLDG